MVLKKRKRFGNPMAALIAWILGNLTGAREKNTSEASSSTSIESSNSSNKNASTSKSKPKRKKKSNEDPTFSTALLTPIEDIIKESITEEEQGTSKSSDEEAKITKKRRQKTKSPRNERPKVETKNTNNKKTELDVADDEDEVGFSFLKVKEKPRHTKKKVESNSIDKTLKTVLQATKKKPDLTKSSIIEHYVVKDKSSSETEKKDSVSESNFEKKSKAAKQVKESAKTKTVDIKQIQKVSKTEYKESKKVVQTVSYANVVVNNFTEESFKQAEQKSKSKLNNGGLSLNSIEIIDKPVGENSTNNTDKVNEEEKSLSSSNSIEVISELKLESSQKKTNIETEEIRDTCQAVEKHASENCLKNVKLKAAEIQRSISSNSIEVIDELEIESCQQEHHKKYTNNTPEFVEKTIKKNISCEDADSKHINNKIESTSFELVNVESENSVAGESAVELSKNIDYDQTIADHIIEDYLAPITVNSNLADRTDFTETTVNSSTDIQEVDKTEEEQKVTMTQVRILTLNDKEHQESTLYRIEKNWVIQFRPGPTLFGRKVKLFCNYPEDCNGDISLFDRKKYYLLNWQLDEGCKNADDTALYTQITVKISGSFHYYFVYENDNSDEWQGSGYFLVDPILKYGNNEELPLDCIQCQTILSKGLGSFSTWENKLRVAKECGYNMIHFTPIQELGESNSSYSLSEQLKLNPLFSEKGGKQISYEDVEKLVAKLRKEWKITSICDIVLNHTANESKWLQEHPECTYNCLNCPYMRPSYLLDAAFHQFSLQVKKGLFEDRGIPAEVCTEDHLNAIQYHFRVSILEPLKIHEMFIVDTNKYTVEFMDLAKKTPPVDSNADNDELRIIQDPEYRRLKSRINMDLAINIYNVYRGDCFDEDSRLRKSAEEFKKKIDSLNNAIITQINDHLNTAIENVIAGIRYFRVQEDGPKLKDISIKHPLVCRYFTDFGTPQSISEHEEIMYSENGAFLMAHNGWVMNSDPLRNFAAPDSNVYIRREIIAWGDSVKLRYGEKPEDCPFLWSHMRQYVEQTAMIFDGVRLDNCHSTPIPVAEYLLDCARRVRPDLYVVAELFTNSDLTDNIFVNRLGISSLIREAMSAWDSHEEGRLVYRYGGSPVGSFFQPAVRPLIPSVAHALFLDLTHDNPSPVEKRSVFDLLPSTALVNMACCASGSNRGYDELVPHHIHVVDEIREYTEWTDNESLAIGNTKYVSTATGIMTAKKALNDLHFKLGKEGFDQVYVDQMDTDIVAVTRHCPKTHQSYVLIAFTAFTHPSPEADKVQRGVKPFRVEGVLDEIVLEADLSHVSVRNGGSKFTKFESFVKDSKYINGLSEYQVNIKQHIQLKESEVFEQVDSGTHNVIQLNFKNFKPGSIVIVKISVPEDMRDSLKSVHKLIGNFSATKESELKQIISRLTLADLNRALYRCDQEERDEGFGSDTYNIPNFGPMVYAGIQGIISLLSNIRPNNDLGHPMCANLRDGNWMIDYVWKRLLFDIGTKDLGQWIEENTKCFKNMPRYLVPCYFDVVITGIYINLVEQCYKLMSDFSKNGSTFVRGLSLGSVQMAAYIKSADLPVLSPNLRQPKPPMRKNEKGELVQACVTLSAGLPHFSVGYMRNWGRDTFIAMRGLFILTGRFEEARQHILGYGACLRHGLIPNLLDGGRNPRYNCRDAVWWWLHCIKEYVEECPDGVAILSDKVSRIFPTDDSPAVAPGMVDQPLHQVMQEALQVHFQGLVFRERNAGKQIDEHMTDNGFNVQIGVHPDTGFVFGGNQWNCGTWMDKMGSSDKAGNRGKPATPRDGSAIELIGLSKAVVTWLSKLNKENKYPYDGVEREHKNGTKTKWTFEEWSAKIQANFEKYFWVNIAPIDGEIQSKLINKRGIYKDSHGSSLPWTDFQLRCNFPIAMVVAPELFNPKHAWVALQNAEKYLLGPLGMKTLDPEDWAYRGDYDNSNDSDDINVAHGFNYHQGPEWVWPIGFFLRARLIFAQQQTLESTKVILAKHFTELQTSPWRGLPELTNSNGAYCKDSSRTQAWSMSCVLEVLHDLQKIESKQIIVN